MRFVKFVVSFLAPTIESATPRASTDLYSATGAKWLNCLAMSLASSPFSFSIASREEKLLARYAVRSRESRGRRYPEEEHPYRGPFQRDRDRILHSAAFRRLSGKMQVFTGEMGDYHRTRLTHSFEVSSIARTMGRFLRLNEDLIEAMALFHDIGHPPFGHAGEEALNACLHDVGGFSHNRHALTIAEELEERHRPYPGLNLTWEVLAGQSSRIHKSDARDDRTWEACIVDAADSLAYDAHDVDDAIKLGLVQLDDFHEVPLLDATIRRARMQFGDDSDGLRKRVVHELLDSQVTRVLQRYAEVMEKTESIGELVESGMDDPSGDRKQLEEFLFQRVYRHPQVIRHRTNAMGQLKRLYARLCQQPELLPAKFRQRCDQVGEKRSVGDYLACMTDRYCSAQYQRLFN